jgi:hypothetical protein
MAKSDGPRIGSDDPSVLVIPSASFDGPSRGPSLATVGLDCPDSGPDAVRPCAVVWIFRTQVVEVVVVQYRNSSAFQVVWIFRTLVVETVVVRYRNSSAFQKVAGTVGADLRLMNLVWYLCHVKGN